MMRNITFTASLVAACAALAGCVHTDGPYNPPSQERLRLESKVPQTYAVQVADGAEVPVAADGRVVVEIPRLQRRHAAYLFGVAKVSESSPEDMPAIALKKEGRTVRKFSLNDLKKLQTDGEGYKLLKVE